MQAILITNHSNINVRTPIGELVSTSDTSVRDGLATYAGRHFGRQGQDWRFSQCADLDRAVFGVFVRGVGGNEGSEIRCED